MAKKEKVIGLVVKMHPNAIKRIQKLEEVNYAKCLLEQEATIRTWHFMWKFPFIKIVNFTSPIKDMQKLVDIQMNLVLDNRRRVRFKKIAESEKFYGK